LENSASNSPLEGRCWPSRAPEGDPFRDGWIRGWVAARACYPPTTTKVTALTDPGTPAPRPDLLAGTEDATGTQLAR
jgi:hypothetical protein